MSVSILAQPAPHEFVERLPDTQEMLEHQDHLARYRFALQWAPGSHVLDICCGIGYGSFLLAAAGGKKVLGVDISEEAVGVARNQPALPNLSFEIADACAHLPGMDSWDLVTCFEGIEHVPSPELLLNRIYKALKPGGLAIVSTPNADAFGGHSGNPFHLSEMPEAEYRKLVGVHDWKVQWYAQIGEWIWNRPRWQQTLLKAAGRGGSSSSNAPASPAENSAARPGKLDVDSGYPMPWKRALSVSAAPPPVIIAVCQKPE